jgi:hypothetical protein
MNSRVNYAVASNELLSSCGEQRYLCEEGNGYIYSAYAFMTLLPEQKALLDQSVFPCSLQVVFIIYVSCSSGVTPFMVNLIWENRFLFAYPAQLRC